MEQAIFKQSLWYMFFAAALATVLGIIMLGYPGGTVAMMSVAFWALQVIISVFILSYAITESVKMMKMGSRLTGVGYLLLGIAAMVLVWVFDVRLVYLIVAVFFVLTGMREVFSAFSLPGARYFLGLLGLLNIIVGAVILKSPVILPLLLAWYVLFWGVSRFFLALELRRICSES
ncbi:MAG: hypothetical protein WC956_01280 [bacterium]